MSDPQIPRREHPSTYFVQDRSNEEEFARMKIQDHLATMALGGVLPEQTNPQIFQRVLDVGCGVGGWLIEAARTYPTMSLLVGVDVSGKMIEYARAQAEEQQVNGRVEFHTMDALLLLEFPTGFFDLVNQRFGASFLRKWDWPKLLQEYKRVTRPRGVIRITEGEMGMESTSPALMRLLELSRRALYQAGHSFTPESTGVTDELASLLEQHGLQNVRTRLIRSEHRAGTLDGQHFIEDMKRLFRTVIPFLRRWIAVPDNYEEIYQQMLNEVQQPDFVATGGVLTVWGTKPA
jgi:ubiquinone/menaquinone biosynthesis C-methylase UbiE